MLTISKIVAIINMFEIYQTIIFKGLPQSECFEWIRGNREKAKFVSLQAN